MNPYVKDELKAPEAPKNGVEKPSSFKERLQRGFNAFSDNDI